MSHGARNYISESLKFQIFLEEYALVPLCFIIGFQNV